MWRNSSLCFYVSCWIQFQRNFGFSNPVSESLDSVLGHLFLLLPLVCFLSTFEFCQELCVDPCRPPCLISCWSEWTALELGGANKKISHLSWSPLLFSQNPRFAMILSHCISGWILTGACCDSPRQLDIHKYWITVSKFYQIYFFLMRETVVWRKRYQVQRDIGVAKSNLTFQKWTWDILYQADLDLHWISIPIILLSFLVMQCVMNVK